MTRCILVTALLAAVLAGLGPTAQAVDIVSGGRSSYVIYHDSDAPLTVRVAAREARDAIAKATGVKLRIVTKPAPAMIALGDHEVARKARVNAEGLKPDGFRMVTRGPHLFIVGRDTPKGAVNKWGGVSAGTLYGTYEFLERHLDARWLLPGEAGEDIPRRKRLKLPPVNRTYEPPFPYRRMPYVGALASGPAGDACRQWLLRNRLWTYLRVGRERRLIGAYPFYAGHVWQRVFSKEELAKHPDHVALVGGKRSKTDNHFYKLCTTNPAVVRGFGDFLLRAFDAKPDRRLCSVSPTDGGGWCQCPRCAKLDTPKQWPLEKDPSRTRRILTLYNALAERIAARRPDRFLAGYVYQGYAYPWSDKRSEVKVHPNVLLCVAPSDYYGIGLYAEEAQREAPRLFAAWAKLAPNPMVHYNLSTMICANTVRAPWAPGLSIMELVFPALLREKYLGALFYGQTEWGVGGAHNYTVARLMWDPRLKPREVFREWLERAYGAEAAKPMGRLYALLEDVTREYARRHARKWLLTSSMIVKIYVKNLDRIEALCREANAARMTPGQKRRLEMFNACMKVLHWNLRKAKLLKAPRAAMYYLDDAAYRRLIKDWGDSIAMGSSRKLRIGMGKRLLKPRIFLRQDRKLRVPRVKGKAPVIDGDLSDASWARATVAGPFYRARSTDLAEEQTLALVMFDARHVYLGFRCRFADRAQVRDAKVPRDAKRIYRTDCVEALIGPMPSDEDREMSIFPKDHWHVTASCAGSLWDAAWRGKRYDVKVNLPIRHAARVNRSDYVVEMAIPWKGLGLGDPAGKAWRVNLCRENPARRENSSWNPVETGFVNAPDFGTWVFEE